MITPGFLDPKSLQDLTDLAQDRLAPHRLPRRGNASVLLEDGIVESTTGAVTVASGSSFFS